MSEAPEKNQQQKHKPKLFITGISGFLGYHLAQRLKKDFLVVGVYFSHPVFIPDVQTFPVSMKNIEALDTLMRIHAPDFTINAMGVIDKRTVIEHEKMADTFNVGLALSTAVLAGKLKAKHIQLLIKQKRRLSPEKAPTVEELALLDEEQKNGNIKKVLRESENELKMARFGRGVETMYRTTYRTHTNLSSMADSKANLMLSVNAIVISILVSNLLPKLQDGPTMKLVIPTMLLTATCLGSMVFATLATRPKVTEGKVTREAIRARKANLLFFGNFYNMSLDEFQWGVNEMLKDPEFLYSSMSRDLYFLGIVLAKKYQYLSICYNIFMYGLIFSVAAFAISFVV